MKHIARTAPWLGALLLVVSIAASAQDAFTTRAVSVRAGPDTSYPAIAVLGTGAPVQVMGCLDDWSWCDVVFGDNRGWVYAPYLSYLYQGYRVPFYSYAPSFGIPIVTFSLGSYWDRYYRGRPWYGRRDYWASRGEPRHTRPSGPPPRSTPPPPPRAYPQASDRRGYDGNRTGEGNRAPYSRTGSATQLQGPPPAHQNGPSAPRGAEQRTTGPTRNAPQPTVERAHTGEQHGGPPPSRGGGEQRSGDRGEHQGQGKQGPDEKQR